MHESRLCVQMHINGANTIYIDDMSLPELEELRYQLRITRTALCERADINVSSYRRWMKYMHGLPGGVCPRPRSVRAVRDALRAEVLSRKLPKAHVVGSFKPIEFSQ